MAITGTQAKMLTGIYSSLRQTGIFETRIGRRVFTDAYFLYKRHIEDPFWALAKRQPELFAGGHIFDVGANIGYTSTVFARFVDRAYNVYAFEPEPFNFRLLNGVLARTELYSSVIPVQAAVGNEKGGVKLWLNEHHHADHRIFTGELCATEGSARVISVPLTSIDTFIRERGIQEEVAFIKVDVQGYEFPVCIGMRETLLANKNAVVALEYMPKALQELGFEPPTLLKWFADLGFRVYSLKNKGVLEPEISGDLTKYGYIDLIFSRRALM